MAATQGWSNLQPELLELVIRRLVLTDYLKCRRVCRSWRSMVDDATKNKCPLLPEFPSLLFLPETPFRGEFPATLLDIARNKIRLSIQTRAWEGYSQLVQSREGWLMFREYIPKQNNKTPHTFFWMFNPVSDEKFMLPLLPYSLVNAHCVRVAFSSAPDSQNLLVVVYFLDDNSTPQLHSCKVNDKLWTRVETNVSCFKDIILDGWKLYGVLSSNCVTIFNLKDLNAITIERLVMHLPKPNRGFEMPGLVRECRLVREPTSGELLVVLFTKKYFDYKIKNIHIFKLAMEGPKWIEVDNLSGCVIFVDSTGAQVISTTNFNGPPEFIEGNCVFFSLYPYKVNPPLEVFFLKEKTLQQLYVVNPSKTPSQSFWFTPSPW